MSLAASMLKHTLVYRAWQAPFAGQKFAPVLAHNPLHRVRRVLDVACGPGTVTKYFAGADYLGIDFNERYIQDARRRHGRNFMVVDVRDYIAVPEDRFDFVLVNSFLHHLDTKDVLVILTHLTKVFADRRRAHSHAGTRAAREAVHCPVADPLGPRQVCAPSGGVAAPLRRALRASCLRAAPPCITRCTSRGGRGHEQTGTGLAGDPGL